MQKITLVILIITLTSLWSFAQSNNLNVYIGSKNKIDFLEIKSDSGEYIRFDVNGNYAGGNADYSNFHFSRNLTSGKLQIDDASINGVRYIFQYSFENISRVYSADVSYDFSFWDNILYEIKSGINSFKYYNTVTKRLSVTNEIPNLYVYRVYYPKYKEESK